jgi:aromatic-L-amino-acid decarboxylase
MCGTAAVCPEYRHIHAGLELADSYCFNPHKWMFTNFDCDCFYVADRAALIRTLSILPDYLKNQATQSGAVIDYRDWHVQLGRRFRALKLWFVLRAYGLEGLRTMIRNHVTWSRALCERLRAAPGFEIVTEPMYSLFSFRCAPAGARDLDALNLRFVEALNADGRIYLTQTRVDGRVAIRFQVGQFECTQADVMSAYDVVTEIAARL